MTRGGNPQTLDRCTTDGRHSHVRNVSVLKSLQYLRIIFWGISPWTMWNQGSPDTSEGGIVTRKGCVSPPFSLIQNKTDDFSASFGLLRRKALQPFPQTFATFPSNVCNLCLKRLQPLPQTFASFASNVCKYLQPSPQSIASFPASVCLFWHKRYPSPDFVHPIPTCRYAPPRPSENSVLRILDFQIISCTAWI